MPMPKPTVPMPKPTVPMAQFPQYDMPPPDDIMWGTAQNWQQVEDFNGHELNVLADKYVGDGDDDTQQHLYDMSSY